MDKLDKFLDKHLKSKEAKFLAKASLWGGLVALAVIVFWILSQIVKFFS